MLAEIVCILFIHNYFFLLKRRYCLWNLILLSLAECKSGMTSLKSMWLHWCKISMGGGSGVCFLPRIIEPMDTILPSVTPMGAAATQFRKNQVQCISDYSLVLCPLSAGSPSLCYWISHYVLTDFISSNMHVYVRCYSCKRKIRDVTKH